jgi:tetratricopeptide (TPR) repeat protein
VAGGKLIALSPKNPNDELIRLQSRLRLGEEEALAAFRARVRARPKDAQTRAFYGELLLWLGSYAECGRQLEKALALDPGLRWPHLGLGAAAVMRGDLEAAFARFEDARRAGASPSALWVWEGEALRKAGRNAEAREVLERAVRSERFRPGAWLNLALVQSGRERETTVARLREKIGPFLDEAGALERALSMLRGNRSSWLYTYYDARGRLKNLIVAPNSL